MSSPSTEPPTEPDYDWRCYKHPDREAGVKCTRCERPICGDCMLSAPVGFQCRECVKGAPAVRTLRSLRTNPYVTMALIAANAAVFVGGQSQGDQSVDLGLWGPFIALQGEWWRLITSGFVHADLLHLAFNMLLLWLLGNMLEPSMGRLRFGVLYAGALLAGSLGPLVADPDALTVGASGAVFGVMGGAFLLQRRQGIDPMQSGIGGLLVINLLLSFRPGISWSGHVGGLLGGLLLALVLDRFPTWVGIGLGVLLTLAFFGAGLWVAENPL